MHKPAAAVAALIFGPYLVGGVRTEQLAIYGTAACLVAVLPHRRITLRHLLVVALWAAMALMMVVVATDPPRSSLPYGSFLAGLDNYLLPLACLGVVLVWRDHDKALNTFGAVVVGALALNTLLIAASLAFDLESVMRPFWAPLAATESVAERALVLGRHGGVFNQPAEAGTAYSLGLVFVVSRWRRADLASIGLLVILGVGGMLSVSKVFILVGLPVATTMFALKSSKRIRQIVIAGGALLTLLGVMLSGLVPWRGQDRLERLLSAAGGDEPIVEVISAGRYGQDSSLLAQARTVWNDAPITGYGIQGVEVAYDSAWLALLVAGGIIAIVIFLAVCSTLLWQIIDLRSRLEGHQRRLAAAVFTVAVGASFGLPAFTGNRIGSIVWIVLGLILMSPRLSTRRPSTSIRRTTRAQRL